MHRRDILIGGACVAALGVAEALRPRRIVTLKERPGKLADMIPRRFGDWQSAEGGDIVVPRTPDSLSDQLYGDVLTRMYSPVNALASANIMLLVAYGRSQTDALQLHRPESCYPAVGFTISGRRLVDIPLTRNAAIPGVELTAENAGRVEDIIYWSRLGEYLPQTAGDQRRDRLKTAMQGIVPDGILVRCSMTRTGPQPRFNELLAFLSGLMTVINPVDRRVMIGTELNRKLGSTLDVEF